MWVINLKTITFIILYSTLHYCHENFNGQSYTLCSKQIKINPAYFLKTYFLL
ncbi:hypothetical protein BH09BAC6_BH09BAC6_35760 [soil metagenome]